MAIPVLCVVSKESGMGKTFLMRALIEGLTRRGFQVGTIKRVHTMQVDQPGKDSWVFMEAGARSVAILGPERSAVIRKTSSPETPSEIMDELGSIDLVLIEGFKESPYPKIEVVRVEKGTEPVSPLDQLFAVVSDGEIPGFSIPVFRFDALEALVERIIQGFLSPTFTKGKSESPLTHLDATGKARMVDVSEKPLTYREALAKGRISMSPSTLSLLLQGGMPKGDVLSVARIAAVQGVKETSRLIPLCHPLPISHIDVSFQPLEGDSLEVSVRVKTHGPTGVEMEALTGVHIALLTIYDMCKAVDKSMVMGNIRLMEKRGGKSGPFIRQED